MSNENKLLNPNIVWHVTTEGDCEGKSITNLGYFKGSVLEIARQLRGKEGYQLNFKEFKVDALPAVSERGAGNKEIHFSVSGYSKEQLEKELSSSVQKSNLYGAVKYVLSEDEMIESKKQSALAKLSKEDRKALGLE